MPGSPVAVRVVACLPGRWLSPRLGQHMSLSAVSRVPTCVVPRTYSSYGNRTFAAAGPQLSNSTSPAAQSRHELRTIQTTAEGSSLREQWTRHGARWLSICSAIEKRVTYLLTYLGHCWLYIICHVFYMCIRDCQWLSCIMADHRPPQSSFHLLMLVS